MSETRHRWTQNDDIIAYYLERFGDKQLPFGEAKIAKLLGLKESSLEMRQSNFAALHGRHGLGHVAEQSRAIFEQYRGKGEAELRLVVLGILGSLPAK